MSLKHPLYLKIDFWSRFIPDSVYKLEDSEKNLIKATDSVSNAKKYIKDGRGSLYNKAEEMRKLGANNKKELNIN